jgi:alginate O-acetyltransferase complex protein AlgI
VRGGELLPQYEAPRRLEAERVARGAAIFLLGFIKKAYFADYLGQYLVDPIFAAPARYSVAAHWMAMLAYAAQVFLDFSGYSEMAIGTGRLFGIELPVNFNYPFLSRSLVEMWRRWHITLNTFLFDYIYGPLTTGEGWMRGRLDLGFVVVFLISGIWHGANWTFVAWGLLHGVALVAHRRWDVFYRGLCRKDRAWVARRKSTGYAAAGWALTQLYFVLTIIPFRAPSLTAAGEFARGLWRSPGRLFYPDGLTLALRPLHLLLCVGFMIGYHLLELERGRPVRARFFALPPFVRGLVYGVIVVLLVILVPESSSSFVYAQF